METPVSDRCSGGQYKTGTETPESLCVNVSKHGHPIFVVLQINFTSSSLDPTFPSQTKLFPNNRGSFLFVYEGRGGQTKSCDPSPFTCPKTPVNWAVKTGPSLTPLSKLEGLGVGGADIAPLRRPTECLDSTSSTIHFPQSIWCRSHVYHRDKHQTLDDTVDHSHPPQGLPN